MTVICSHIPCYVIWGHMPVYTLYKSICWYMTVICRHILFPKSICPHVTVICFRSLARDMAVYDRHMTVYDGKGASFSSHSCCCDQYKTCYTSHFCFCIRYMTSCDWNMLAHPALPSFVPGGTRLARLNVRLPGPVNLNAAHLPQCCARNRACDSGY